MLALRKTRSEPGLRLLDIEPPRPDDGEVLVRVSAAGICGTDLHIDDWSPGYHFVGPALPVTLGHELSGTVVGRGAGTDRASLPEGAQVVVMPSVTCGRCPACRSGDRDACTTRSGIGVTQNGGFAAFMVAPAENCLPVPAGLDPGIAALTEPLTVAWQAVRRGGVGPGIRVLVLGPGAIGLAIALMARRAGATEVVIAGHDDGPRLGTARALGFDRVFDLALPDGERGVTAAAGKGFDVVMEATGAPEAITFGIARLRPTGTLVATGIHERPAPLDVTALVRAQLDVRGSYRAPLAAWPEVIAMLADDPAAFAPLVTRRMPLAEGLAAVRCAHDRSETKVLLIPEA